MWITDILQTIGAKNKSLVNNSVNNSFEFQGNKTPHLMNRESKTTETIYVVVASIPFCKLELRKCTLQGHY